MSSSRSHFYVDLPIDHKPPSQRHSMYVSHSEVDASINKDLSSASSSATLPSAAGSVDRLTGLGSEKKTPRFFTLKPKTSFSLRPFFSSSSIPSLSPSKRRKKGPEITQRQDSYVQTDDNQRLYDEVGVQTQNASTVDVPVQTCSNEWDESDTYKKPLTTKPTFFRSPYGDYSTRWSSSVASEPPGLVLDENKSSKNSYVTPLDSSKLLKYATPLDSAGSSSKPASAKLLGNERSLDSVTYEVCLQPSASQLSKPLSVSENSTVSHSAKLSDISDPKSLPTCTSDIANINDVSKKPLLGLKNCNESNSKTSHQHEKDAVQILKSNSDTKDHLIRASNSPTSVLKIDRTDSPKPNKVKTVHFQISDPNLNSSIPKTSSPILKTDSELIKPRNIDKEFEALLRNLDILPEEPDKVDINISQNTVPQTPPKVNYISPDLKTALDALKQDFLAPIPENDVNSDDNPERNTDEYSANANDAPSSANKKFREEDLKINIEVDTTDEGSQNKQTPTHEDESGNKPLDLEEKSCSPTSPAVTSAELDLDVETTPESAKVYNKENTGEPVKTVQLPTLPSFFESSVGFRNTKANDFIDPRLESSVATPSCEDSNESMLSRSSSRSSMRSNPRSDFESCLERASKFDSCENLDQLEEEIIRSLYSPEGDINDNIEDPNLYAPQLDNSAVSAAPSMRRVILDRLLSGESVGEIMPSSPNTVDLDEHFINSSNIRKKVKPCKKYIATLSKFEEPNTENSPVMFTPLHHSRTNAANNIKNSNNYSSTDAALDPYGKSCPINSMKPFKESSVFLFPDSNSQSSDATPKVAKHLPSNEMANTNKATNSSFSTNIHCSNSSDEAYETQNLQKCDFTNCLRPSKLQNSPFLAEISSKSSVPRYSLDIHPASQIIPPLKSPDIPSKGNEAQHPKQTGQCDFAHCLKPSQVQNSIFTAELSELTANKSSNFGTDSSRTNSPLTTRISTPTPTKSDSWNQIAPIMKEKDIPSEDNSKSEIQHRAELTIVLKPPSLDKIANANEATYLNHGENQSSVPETNALPMQNKQSENVPSITAVIPPPPPPPPASLSKVNKSGWKINDSSSLESQIQDQQANLSKPIVHSMESRSSPKTPVVLELEKKFEKQSQVIPKGQNSGFVLRSMSEPVIELPDLKSTKDKRSDSNEGFRSHSPLNSKIYKADSNGFSPGERIKSPSLVNGQSDGNYNGSAKPSNTIITNEPPPPGAVLIDKKVTVDGDKVHTDKYYALPVKEVLKETTSTTKFIPAPPKYEGIGPTEDGIPIAPRNSVKKENMHNWYKTMFKSLHKADSSNDPQEYIIGYSSEPESSKKDKIVRKKSSTLDNRSSNNNDSKCNNNNLGPGYPPSAKSSIETYKVHPRLIEDYEPGHSSVTDDEINYGSKRYLPPMNVPKPSYEFKNGYEQDNHFTKKLEQPDPPSVDQQKKWYKDIQHGGEVPHYGLGKPAPEKLQEPSVGPLPQPPLHYSGPTVPTQGIRPLTLPSEYSLLNENGLCQQVNGAYEIQMREAIHTELHQRLSPSSSQLSSPTRSILKSPCRSPDLKIPARALFDFRPESPKEIPLKKGDNVLVLRQLDKNWYEGEKQGVVGIFPISYIEVVPPEHASLPQSSFEGMGKVLYDFTAHAPVELSVKKHDMITLLRRVDSNWYEAKLQNKKGIVPVSYLQVLQEPIERGTPLSSPNSLISSSGSRPTSREGILKTVSPSSQFSPNSSHPTVVTNGRNNFQSRGKKTSSLIEPVMYRALYSYTPQNSDELELAEGDTVYVVELCDDGWYVGTSVRTGVFGIFPGNYVEKVYICWKHFHSSRTVSSADLQMLPLHEVVSCCLFEISFKCLDFNSMLY